MSTTKRTNTTKRRTTKPAAATTRVSTATGAIEAAPAVVLAGLKAKGKNSAVTIYRRHGVTGETWGVSYADLDVCARQHRGDHSLARALWTSGVHDARVLATKIADPAATTDRLLDAWVSDCTSYVITDAVAGLTARTASAWDAARRWIDDQREYVSTTGWKVLALLAVEGRLTATQARPLLGRIERGITSAPNMTRYAMNGTLIAIGGRITPLRPNALAVARRIGTVEVDHGDTGCRTPDAADYIRKMAAGRARPRSGTLSSRSGHPL